MSPFELVAVLLVVLAGMTALAGLLLGAYPEFFEGLLPGSEDEDETKEN